MIQPGVADVVDELIEALRRAGKPPCDGCIKERPCADRELACPAFTAYVEGEEWSHLERKPSRRQYALLYPTEAQKVQRAHLRERMLARSRKRRK